MKPLLAVSLATTATAALLYLPVQDDDEILGGGGGSHVFNFSPSAVFTRDGGTNDLRMQVMVERDLSYKVQTRDVTVYSRVTAKADQTITYYFPGGVSSVTHEFDIIDELVIGDTASVQIEDIPGYWTFKVDK